jgi:hypothetical protein
VVPIGTIVEAGAPAVDRGPVDGDTGEFLTVWNEGDYSMYACHIQADNALVGDPWFERQTEDFQYPPSDRTVYN